MAKKSAAELATDLMEFAKKNYNVGGWSAVVECWTVKELEEKIEDLFKEGTVKNKAEVMKYFKTMFGRGSAMDERLNTNWGEW